MGQSTVNETTTQNVTVIQGGSNSVVPSTSNSAKAQPTQSVSPSTSLTIPSKAESLNPVAAVQGKTAVSNRNRDFLQSLCSLPGQSLNPINKIVSDLNSNGSSTKESLDKINALSPEALHKINIALPDVLNHASASEVASKVSLTQREETTGFFGGIIRPSDPNLAFTTPTTVERINSSANVQGVSTYVMQKKSAAILDSLAVLRSGLETLSQPLGTGFTSRAHERSVAFEGYPYPVEITSSDPVTLEMDIPYADGDETIVDDNVTPVGYAMGVKLVVGSPDLVSPLVRVHTTNKASSEVLDSGRMRLIGKTPLSTTWFCDVIVHNRAVSITLEAGVPLWSFEATSTILDIGQTTLNIPAEDVVGITVSRKLPGFALFGRCVPSGASTGPGDIRFIWNDATTQIAPFLSSISAHPHYDSAVQAVVELLQTKVSFSSTDLESIVHNLFLYIPLYPYTIGPIAPLLEMGMKCEDIMAVVLTVLNFLDSLLVHYVTMRDATNIAYAYKLNKIANTRDATL